MLLATLHARVVRDDHVLHCLKARDGTDRTSGQCPLRYIKRGIRAGARFGSAPGGILHVVASHSYADGTGYDSFVARGSAMQADIGAPAGICMDGPGILNFALRKVPEAINAALDAQGLDLGQLRMVLFHQANSFMVGQLMRKLKLSPEQAPQNCEHLGNTVSASIPLLLADQWSERNVGDFALAVGFGVGLSWGTLLLQRVPDTYP